MKKTTHYDAVIRMKDNNQEEKRKRKKTFSQMKQALELLKKAIEDGDPERIANVLISYGIPAIQSLKDEQLNDNIISVLSISEENFTERFLNKIKDMQTCSDKIPGLSEHIFDVEQIKNNFQEHGTVLDLETAATLEGIQIELDKYNCCYFRIINRNHI